MNFLSLRKFGEKVWEKKMAGNEWINGYLEAILDSGASAIEEQKPVAVNLRERGHFNPTKYFVEEVVTGVDESDLHRTWIKVVATRNTRDRSSRLENMCWRIWHLARKKKQVLLILSVSVHLCLMKLVKSERPVSGCRLVSEKSGFLFLFYQTFYCLFLNGLWVRIGKFNKLELLC